MTMSKPTFTRNLLLRGKERYPMVTSVLCVSSEIYYFITNWNANALQMRAKL